MKSIQCSLPALVLQDLLKLERKLLLSQRLIFLYKTFAENDYAMDEYQNDISSPINEHALL